MTVEPEIKPLPYVRRTWIFRLCILAFLLALPVIIFQATGYRLEFTKNSTSIVSTGGIYIGVAADETDIYLDEELVRDIRVFRSASYIQNLDVGLHRIHTQGEGLYTWVKELPVQPHIVTEVQSFNMPLVPQIRLVAPYINLNGMGMYDDMATTTLAEDFTFASTTRNITASTTVATTTLLVNQEYDYVISLFGTTTDEENLVEQLVHEVNDAFTFSSATNTPTTTEIATTTIVIRNTKLFEKEGEVYATWLGRREEIPYYFCIDHEASSSTRAIYGEHVLESVASVIEGIPETESQQVTKRVCREEIRIDRLHQEVKQFTFLPGSTDLVLMLLNDGLYVVEVDDRSWQNTQQIYPGTDIKMAVENDRIYVFDRGYYLELFTEIESS